MLSELHPASVHLVLVRVGEYPGQCPSQSGHCRMISGSSDLKIYVRQVSHGKAISVSYLRKYQGQHALALTRSDLALVWSIGILFLC